MKIALLVLCLGFLAGFVAPTRRATAAAGLGAGAVAWAAIYGLTGFDIPPNEPEWWGGLGIACALALVGAAAGHLVRERRAEPGAG